MEIPIGALFTLPLFALTELLLLEKSKTLLLPGYYGELISAGCYGIMIDFVTVLGSFTKFE